MAICHGPFVVMNAIYVIQVRKVGNPWQDIDTYPHTYKGYRAAVKATDEMLDHAKPGFYDGSLRIIERLTTERTVLRVNKTHRTRA